MKKSLPWVLSIITVLVALNFVYQKYIVQPDIQLNQIAVQDLNDRNIDLQSYIGKPMVINYWATWCAPCIKEFPYFEEVKQQLGNQIHFIMISDEPVKKVQNFKDSKSYSFTYLQSKYQLSDIGIYIRPTTYFYNFNGDLIDKYSGSQTLEKLKAFVHQLE